MQHPMYTLDAQRQKWQIVLIDEDDLSELAHQGRVAEDSLLYNPETEHFISAKEYALLIGNARGLRTRRRGVTLPSCPSAANAFGGTSTAGRYINLPSEHHTLKMAEADTPALPSSAAVPNATLPAALVKLQARPVYQVWETSPYSHMDEVIEGYVPAFRTSVRLQTIGLLMLPLFGLGLPLLLEGSRRKNRILRLVEQTGMDKAVWINYVSERVAAFPSEQKAFRVAAAFVFLVAASAAASEISKPSVRAEIGHLSRAFSPATSRSLRAKHSHPMLDSQSNLLNP